MICAAAPPTSTRTPRRFRLGKRHSSGWPGRAHVGMPRHPRRTNAGPGAGPPVRQRQEADARRLIANDLFEAAGRDRPGSRKGPKAAAGTATRLAAPSRERSRRGTELPDDRIATNAIAVSPSTRWLLVVRSGHAPSHEWGRTEDVDQGWCYADQPGSLSAADKGSSPTARHNLRLGLIPAPLRTLLPACAALHWLHAEPRAAPRGASRWAR